MLVQMDVLDLASYDSESCNNVSDELEQEITTLLRGKAPNLSARTSFRIAAGLVDSAAATIVTLRSRVTAVEAERDKLTAQESDWEGLVTKWRDMSVELTAQVRDLESKLVLANQRIIDAERRAQNTEKDIVNVQQGSFDLCDKVIAVFGVTDSLLDRVCMITGETAGSC